MTLASEGYILIAANKQHYLELAVSAACSIRLNDHRPIALLISGGLSVPRIYHNLFDHIVAFDPSAPYDGMFVRRFVLENYSPFERCMHVDADCLLIGDDIERFWTLFKDRPFGVMAQLHKSGKCYRDTLDVDEVVRAGIAPGVFVTNWGVFYYQNTGDNIVMRNGRNLLETMLEDEKSLRTSYFSRPGQLSDEPLWGIGLAQTDIPVSAHDYGALLQLTSPNTSEHHFDFAGRKFHAKKGGFPRATGEIYHFAFMHPLDGYLAGTKFYREEQSVPLPAILTESGDEILPEEWRIDIPSVVPRMLNKGRPSFQFANSITESS
ncbi:MAG: hypothetical protein ACX94B_00325 [Henriciella sp.]